MGSRARHVLATSDAERKRLERVLHDNAQQRLVAVTTTLGLALRRLEAGNAGADLLVEEACQEARRCLDDLRDLARDIYPAVLAERGLASALNDLACRAPAPVSVHDAPEERLPETVELTAFLVAREALSGLAADADAAVSARIGDGALVLEVRGAALGAERLEPLRERLGALGGSIEESTGSAGPWLRATIPFPVD